MTMAETEFQRQQSAGPGLSQIERVADAYVAPTKTFMDIRRNASWWLPFLLGIIVSFLFVSSIDRKIGFEQVAQANINRSAQTQQRMSAMPEAQREHAMRIIATSTKIASYAYPAITLIVALIAAGILMMSFNFGLGAKASYKQYLAVWFYAGLPFLIKYLLAAISIFAGVSAEQFDINNPVGTNIGWYLSSDVPLWLRTMLSSVDVFTIWVVVLLALGCSTVARVKRSSAAIVVVGWWVLLILGFTMGAAIRG
ncbi:MAG: YIP1 family protein [Acidobacteriaceae bacterium]